MQRVSAKQTEDKAKTGSIFKQWFYRNKQWLYRGGKPNWYAKLVNRVWAIIAARSRVFNGLLFDGLVALEVVGRKSGASSRFRWP